MLGKNGSAVKLQSSRQNIIYVLFSLTTVMFNVLENENKQYLAKQGFLRN